jgi:nocardicin N-oxygenase
MSTTAHTVEEITRAHGAFFVYLAELIVHRRANPSDDLLTALITVRDNDDRLSEEELLGLILVLLVAGHETTANQIANFTYLLLTDRKRWELLRADPGLIPAAVEELLRWVQLTLGGFSPRFAKEDVEVGGVTVRAGEAVFTHTPSANRDEAVFVNGGVLDLTRDVNPHIAFGYGVHYCVGAQLARMELQEALGAMLQRFPSLRLAVPADEVPWRAGVLTRGPEKLPLSW